MVDQPGLAGVLRDTITVEVVKATGLSPQGWLGRLLALLVRPATRRFGRLFAAFDDDIAAFGFSRASRRLLPHFVQGCQQVGAGTVPREGPLLLASNHPGATDGIAIAAALGRDDLKIVISDVPFTRAMPVGSGHLIYTPPSPEGRVRAVREMIRHLRSGGVVIIFPSGQLDPDPAFLPGADEGLSLWSQSVALVLRRVPETRLVATIVGGVLSPRFLSHPLTRLGPQGWERQKLAEVLQVCTQLISGARYDLVPKVAFGEPVAFAALREEAQEDLSRAIVAHAARVLAHYARAAGASIL